MHQNTILTMLGKKGINPHNFEIYLRAFKFEKTFEIWVRDLSHDTFTHYQTIPFCSTSGEIGPKRKQGDGQIPEGLYQIAHFNPLSEYFLSMRVNYPNEADMFWADKTHPGGDIYIHGGCETIGCIPITDKEMGQLYVISIMSRNNNNNDFPIHIFPSKMSSPIMKYLLNKKDINEDYKNVWKGIQPVYSYFQKYKKIPYHYVNEQGLYRVLDE
jgi:murein L,D-transpeptidase YafK